MKNQSELRTHLRAIDHRGYPAYKELRGSYDFGDYTLHIDHVQGDPFAAPSAVRVTVDGRRAAFPAAYLSPSYRRAALEDHLVRLFGGEAFKYSGRAHGSGKSGLINVSRPGQEILARSACTVSAAGSAKSTEAISALPAAEAGGGAGRSSAGSGRPAAFGGRTGGQVNGAGGGRGQGQVTFRMEIGFPANGRSINARELEKILFEFLPACVRTTLFYRNIDHKKLQDVIELADDQAAIRAELDRRGLCAFVADGAILPRASGVSDLPMRDAVPFASPDSLRIELVLPHAGKITGMGIRRGITLIAGGGYHGKSTLLHALERGVYNHIRGDGREYVIADDTAMKIRAEDGRSIVSDDISLFISNLPGGKDTVRFSSENASGSTSQAAAVVEADEAGARVLLLDEDTSATNFMVRDALMQQVIARDKEPITPLIEQVRQLFEDKGISTILALGSSGAWFGPADCILQMDQYRPVDITDRAKAAARAFGLDIPAAGTGSDSVEEIADRLSSEYSPSFALPARIPLPDRLFAGDRIKTKTIGRDGFVIDRRTVDLRYVEQIVDAEQSAALAQCLLYAGRHLMDGKRTIPEIADLLLRIMAEEGPGAVGEGGYTRTGLAMPRKQEICAMLSRFRSLRIRD